MNPVLQSESMTPIESALVWVCKQCGHRWLIISKAKPPKRCAKCKSILWNRSKMKMGPKPKGKLKPGPRHKKGK